MGPWVLQLLLGTPKAVLFLGWQSKTEDHVTCETAVGTIKFPRWLMVSSLIEWVFDVFLSGGV